MKSNASRFYWDATFLSLLYIHIEAPERNVPGRPTPETLEGFPGKMKTYHPDSWVFLGKIYRKPMGFPMLPLSCHEKKWSTGQSTNP
jgi:hypothetical protein